MAEGSTDLPGPFTPVPVGRAFKEEGRGSTPVSAPVPPRRPSEHIGRAGREKAGRRGQVDLVVGSVCFQIRTFVNCVAPESMS